MSSIKLWDFPEELIIQIMEELALQDLLSCSATCRLLFHTVQSAKILQYHIELAAAGVEDCGSPSSLTTAERLAELTTQQESWATLRFRQRYTFETPVDGRVWELFGGVMAHGLGGGPETRGLTFLELPSASRGTTGRVWEHPDLKVTIRDFAIDPAQDLVVIISNRPTTLFVPFPLQVIYLFSMSSGRNHPQATYGHLTCTPDRLTDRQGDFIIQIMAEFVAVLFHARDFNHREELYIWNWKTGELLTKFMFPDEMEKMDSFSFLSPRHFVLSKIQRMPVAPDPPALCVYDFLDTNERQPVTPRLVRSFILPQPVDGAIVVSMTTRSDPYPRDPSRPITTDEPPFRTAPSSGILVVGLDIFQPIDNNFESISFLLFVHQSTLLEGLKPGQPPVSGIVAPWHQWGPEKTRMFRAGSTELTWVCYVHGTRFVTLRRFDDHEFGVRDSHLTMLDFNPLLIKRGQLAQDEKGGTHDRELSPGDSPKVSECNIVPASQPTFIHSGEAFEDDITTTLPYREMRSTEKFHYMAALIDEECVVGLQPMTSDGRRAVEVLCF